MYANSRYASGHVDALSVTRNWNTDTAAQQAVYVWKPGDRIDNVATMLGLPKTSWWMILDANPTITNPLRLRPGSGIRLPFNQTAVY